MSKHELLVKPDWAATAESREKIRRRMLTRLIDAAFPPRLGGRSGSVRSSTANPVR
jgi:hypothetical protein